MTRHIALRLKTGSDGRVSRRSTRLSDPYRCVGGTYHRRHDEGSRLITINNRVLSSSYLSLLGHVDGLLEGHGRWELNAKRGLTRLIHGVRAEKRRVRPTTVRAEHRKTSRREMRWTKWTWESRRTRYTLIIDTMTDDALSVSAIWNHKDYR